MAGLPMKATADQSPEFWAPQRTAVFSMIAAAFLVALKLVTGLITGSLALIAEAAHSGTDLVAAILTFFAVACLFVPWLRGGSDDGGSVVATTEQIVADIEERLGGQSGQLEATLKAARSWHRT